MGSIDVLDRVTVRCHVLSISSPVPMFSQNSLKNIRVGTSGNSVHGIVRAHDGPVTLLAERITPVGNVKPTLL